MCENHAFVWFCLKQMVVVIFHYSGRQLADSQISRSLKFMRERNRNSFKDAYSINSSYWHSFITNFMYFPVGAWCSSVWSGVRRCVHIKSKLTVFFSHYRTIYRKFVHFNQNISFNFQIQMLWLLVHPG